MNHLLFERGLVISADDLLFKLIQIVFICSAISDRLCLFARLEVFSADDVRV